MKIIKFVLIVLSFASIELCAQDEIRIEPPHWWSGMENSNLQLLVRGDSIGYKELVPQSKNLKINNYHYGDSPNYLFIDLDLSATPDGTYSIQLLKKNEIVGKIDYVLKEREWGAEKIKGFDHEDVIYLITPDRFSNGDESNDSFGNLREIDVDRSLNFTRHGGDIRGIINQLDYIRDMGFTALWSSPLLINDMPKWSYHGYAITDYYRVDPRFGTMEEYIELADSCRSKGIKLIMDQVANHCGKYHWWMQDLPFKDWVNNTDVYVQTNHRRTTNQDPYASDYDRDKMVKGWFVPNMPDLNQENPFLANYIIQNSIWWIETLGLGGIRQDTYPYPDKNFMSNWAGAIMEEYPQFSIVGEEWSYNPLLIAYWLSEANNRDGYQSNLSHAMDFAMQQFIVDGLKEKESWDNGLVKIYEGLANDFHYSQPENLLLFGDNHDMDRIHTQLGEDINLTKMALALIIMMPRVPQIYYGTEILMTNSDSLGNHGVIRSDMPGGWTMDSVSAFTGSGLSDEQKDMQLFLKKLLNFRLESDILKKGSTVHFAPEQGVYALARIMEDEIVLLIINKSDDVIDIKSDRFDEILNKKKVVMDIINDKSKNKSLGEIKISPKDFKILKIDLI